MTNNDILSKSKKRQIELNHLLEKAEETPETIKYGKDAHPSTLFGKDINELEKQLEELGQKKQK